ncbi:MAG: exodeoxyribonuclease VII large subunit [Methanomicrobia archaeon]|nr:exodeoxyribonuclease VII large subunit [Methanomicrobia archaeon]
MTLLDFLHARTVGGEEEENCSFAPDNERGRKELEDEKEDEPALKAEEVGGKDSPRIYTVYEVTSHIRWILEEDKELRDVYIKGELSNLSQPTSGHLYFTLKDELSELQCVMFREKNRGLKFVPEDGMSVIVRGRISVYEKRGRYQLYVDEIQEAGIGALYLAFEQLKKKLKEEGLFDAVYKKPIPSFPRRIGIITSPTGAAVRDMLKITKKRFPHVHILLAPVAVQGEEAPTQIVQAIQLMNRYSAERERLDVLIVGRGGGSIEELWAFNEECVAREIFSSVVPVISAVGHETDFTIADFVADKRAATPSEAAEYVVPDKREINKNLRSLELQMRQNVFKAIEYQRRRFESLEKSILFRKPTERINQYRQTVDELKRTMVAELTHRVTLQRKSVQAFMGKLDALSPLAILDRGYSICSKWPEGTIVRSVADISVGDALKVLLKDGEAVSEVKQKEAKQHQ